MASVADLTRVPEPPRLGHSSQYGPRTQQIRAFFLGYEFVEVARHAVGKLGCERALYLSPAKCSRKRPACPSTIESAIGAVDSLRIGCRTNSEFRHLCATFLASALFPFPAIHLRHEDPPHPSRWFYRHAAARTLWGWIRRGFSIPTPRHVSAHPIECSGAAWCPAPT